VLKTIHHPAVRIEKGRILRGFFFLALILCAHLYFLFSFFFSPYRVQKVLEKRLHALVEVADIRLSFPDLLVLEGVLSKMGPGIRPWLKTERILVQIDPWQLIRGQLSFRNIEVHNPELVWNLAERPAFLGPKIDEKIPAGDPGEATSPILPPGPVSQLLHDITIIGGAVTFTSVPGFEESEPVRLNGISAKISRIRGLHRGLRITGDISNSWVARCGYRLDIDERETTVRVDINMTEIAISNELRNRIPLEWRKKTEPFQFRGQFNVNLGFLFNWTNRKPEDIALRVDFLDCSAVVNNLPYKINELPYPITQIHGRLQTDGEDFLVQNVTARIGETEVELSGHRLQSGLEKEDSWFVGVKDLPLNDVWAKAVRKDPRIEKAWSDLNLSGASDAQLKLTHGKSAGLRAQLDFQSDDLHILPIYFKFPTQITNGRIEFDGTNILIKGVESISGEMRTIVNGILEPGKGGAKRLEFTLMNVVLNDAIRTAFDYTPPGSHQLNGQELWDLISPSGKMNGEYVFIRNGDDKSFDLKFKGVPGSIKYEKFPLQVKVHSGEVHWANQKIVLKDFRANHDKAPIRLNANFSPIQPAEGDRISITAEQISLGDELKAALQPDIQRFWEQLALTGTTNITLDLLGLKEGGWRYKMAMDSGLMQIAYENFPCPAKVKACNAEWDKQKLRFTNGMLEAFGAEILLSGEVSLIPKNPSRLRFVFNGMSLESGFQEYLPKEAGEFLNQFLLKGHVDGELEINYGQTTPTTFSLQVRGKGALLAYKGLPIPIQLESAHLTWSNAGFELKQLIGNSGEGLVNASATVPLATGERAYVTLKAMDVAFSETLRNALPSGARAAWDNFEPKGRCDIDAEIEWKSGQKAASQYSVTVGCKDVSAKFKHFPVPLSGLNGKLTLTPGRMVLPKLTGQTGKSPVTIEGSVDWTESLKPDLVIHAENFPLDNEFFALLPEDYQKVWKELNAAGTVRSIDYSLKANAENKLQNTFTASLKEGSLTYQRFPLPLTDLTGTFKWEKGEMKVDDLEGKSFGKPIKANARFSDHAMRVELVASGQAFGQKLYDALPATVQILYKDVSPTGDLDFSVKVDSKWDAVSSHAKFETEINLRNVNANTGADLKSMLGVLRLKGEVYGEELVNMNGTAELKTVEIRDQSFSDVTATIAQEEGRVFIKELRAGYHGGLVRARIDQDRKENMTALDLSFSKVDISAFGKGFGSDSSLAGALRGEIALTIKGSDVQSMKGSGKVSMDGDELFALPTLDAITGLLKGAKTNKIREMHMNFDLLGPNLKVHLMKLIGDNYNVYGLGKISFDWDLDLHLFVAKRSLVTRVANTLGSLPFFKVIPALIEPLQASMLQLELKGPANQATPKSTPFEHSLPKELWEEMRKDGKNI